MTLNRLVRNYVLPIVTALGVACGAEEPPRPLGGTMSQPCRSDAECKGERICVQGYCRDPSGSSDGVEGPCGNSPLVGKYLWFTECGTGTEDPLSPTCSGTFTNISSPEGREITQTFHFTYDGLTLTLNSLNWNVRTLRLIHQFSDNDLPHSGECYDTLVERYQARRLSYEEGIAEDTALARCYLSQLNSLYLLEGDGTLCFAGNPYILVRDEPWPSSKDSCQQTIVGLMARLREECSNNLH